MASNQAKTIEAKKDEFRAYLEKTGVVDQLTKVLVSLYEENDKPSNPLEFIKSVLSTGLIYSIVGIFTSSCPLLFNKFTNFFPN